jgi:hypothetical protein
MDISGELAARHGIRFETYGEAVRALDRVPRFAPDLVSALARLPGFRNIVIHDYLDVDYDLVVAALDELGPIDRFHRDSRAHRVWRRALKARLGVPLHRCRLTRPGHGLRRGRRRHMTAVSVSSSGAPAEPCSTIARKYRPDRRAGAGTSGSSMPSK